MGVCPMKLRLDDVDGASYPYLLTKILFYHCPSRSRQRRDLSPPSECIGMRSCQDRESVHIAIRHDSLGDCPIRSSIFAGNRLIMRCFILEGYRVSSDVVRSFISDEAVRCISLRIRFHFDRWVDRNVQTRGLQPRGSLLQQQFDGLKITG